MTSAIKDSFNKQCAKILGAMQKYKDPVLYYELSASQADYEICTDIAQAFFGVDTPKQINAELMFKALELCANGHYDTFVEAVGLCNHYWNEHKNEDSLQTIAHLIFNKKQCREADKLWPSFISGLLASLVGSALSGYIKEAKEFGETGDTSL